MPKPPRLALIKFNKSLFFYKQIELYLTSQL